VKELVQPSGAGTCPRDIVGVDTPASSRPLSGPWILRSSLRTAIPEAGNNLDHLLRRSEVLKLPRAPPDSKVVSSGFSPLSQSGPSRLSGPLLSFGCFPAADPTGCEWIGSGESEAWGAPAKTAADASPHRICPQYGADRIHASTPVRRPDPSTKRAANGHAQRTSGQPSPTPWDPPPPRPGDLYSEKRARSVTKYLTASLVSGSACV
jgi:hypothetical protein